MAANRKKLSPNRSLKGRLNAQSVAAGKNFLISHFFPNPNKITYRSLKRAESSERGIEPHKVQLRAYMKWDK